MTAAPFSHVRAAHPADLPLIGDVHAAALAHDYPQLLGAAVLADLDARTLTAAWEPAVTTPPHPDDAVLVAIDPSGALTGFTAVGHTGEIVALWVHPDHRRAGHGSRLLAAAADHARTAAATSLSVWTPVEDAPRTAFLVEAGFAPDSAGRRLELPDGAHLDELHLVAGLTP